MRKYQKFYFAKSIKVLSGQNDHLPKLRRSNQHVNLVKHQNDALPDGETRLTANTIVSTHKKMQWGKHTLNCMILEAASKKHRRYPLILRGHETISRIRLKSFPTTPILHLGENNIEYSNLRILNSKTVVNQRQIHRA